MSGGDGHGGGGGHADHDEEHEEHEEHVNHEAWVIPYADLLTLLMAMFIALFAISNVDAAKFKKLAEGLSEEFGGAAGGVVVLDGGSGMLQGAGVSPIQGGAATTTTVPGMLGRSDDPTTKEGATKVLTELAGKYAANLEQAENELGAVKATIEAAAAGTGFAGNLQYRIDSRGLVVTVVTDQVLFGSGSAAVTGGGEQLLGVLGNALRSVDNDILVEGHTDNIPIATSTFPSNWELSTARAGAVVRFFEQRLGLAPGRLQAAGFGDQRPIDTNETEAGRSRNRRVEVVVQSSATKQNTALLEQAVQASDVVNRAESAENTTTTVAVTPTSATKTSTAATKVTTTTSRSTATTNPTSASTAAD